MADAFEVAEDGDARVLLHTGDEALAAARDETGRALVRALAVAGFASANVMFMSIGVWAGHAAGWLDGMGEATRGLLEKRRATQPIGEWSCGSVFTNPPGDHAARLIEATGLKGFRIGGAVVSTKHANFILNEGEASARDIESLIGMLSTLDAEVTLTTNASLLPRKAIRRPSNGSITRTCPGCSTWHGAWPVPTRPRN